MTSTRVLAIAGSPRRNGNTDLLLGQVVAGLVSCGIQPKTIVLSQLQIAPCRHCDGCLKTGKCTIDDDMQWIHQELRELDYLILASPIFFMSVTAQTKAMIDRCQALWVLKYILKIPPAIPQRRRKGIFISVGGTRLSNLFQPAAVTVKSWFKTLDIEYCGELTFSGVDQKGEIKDHATALMRAFELGRKLVETPSVG